MAKDSRNAATALVAAAAFLLLLRGETVQCQSSRRRESHAAERGVDLHDGGHDRNASCSSGVCGAGPSGLGVEYHLSVDAAKRLSTAQSPEDYLEIFGMNTIDAFGEPPLLASTATRFTAKSYPKSGSSPFALSAGRAKVRSGTEPDEDGFGRKTDIDFAANAGCQPERVTVPIKVPENALETRLYHIVPTCTRVERCGGCCNHELLSCQPVAKEIVTMNILAIPMVSSVNPRPLKIPVEVEKHINCSCDCVTKPSDCSELQEHRDCRCVCKNPDEEQLCVADPRRIWDPKTCHCGCRYMKPCATGQYFDPYTCGCESISWDQNNQFIYPNYRNRRPIVTTSAPTTRNNNGAAGGSVSDFAESSSTQATASTARIKAGRFWQRRTETATAPTTTPYNHLRDTPTSPPTTVVTAPGVVASTERASSFRRSFDDVAERDSFPPSHAQPMRPSPQHVRPTPNRMSSSSSSSSWSPSAPAVTTNRMDDEEDDGDGGAGESFSRHRQRGGPVNVPALKAWKVATANSGAGVGSGQATSAASTTGNALDATTYDDDGVDEDAVFGNAAFGSDDFAAAGAGAGGTQQQGNRRGRFHDPNERDRIRNNISAFKKGFKRQ